MRRFLAWTGVVFLVLLVTAAFGAAGYAYSVFQEPQYDATTSLVFGRLLSPELQLLGPDFGEPDIEEEVRIQTEAALVDSYDVAVDTADALSRSNYTPAQVDEQVEVTPVRGSLIVQLIATADDPKLAAQLARTYAKQYLRMRRQQESARAEAVQDSLRRRLDDLTRAEDEGVLGAALRDQISTLGTLERVGSGSPQIIEEARATATAVEPQTTRNTLFGLLFGLIASVGLVAAFVSLRRRAARRREPATLTMPAHARQE